MSKNDMKIYVNAKLYCIGPTIIAVLCQIQKCDNSIKDKSENTVK